MSSPDSYQRTRERNTTLMARSHRMRATWRDPARARDSLVVLLTLVTGATDATGFLKLGGAFTSVMTGNMVLLGVAVGRQSESLASHAGLALIGYVTGSLFGARVAGHAARSDAVWPRQVTNALAVELLLFGVFAVGFEIAGGNPTGAFASTLLTLNAAALGVQSAAVLRFGISGLSTTYLTGTLTTAIARLPHPDRLKGHERSLVILAALVVGAGIGAVLSVDAARAEPALQLVILGFVILAASRQPDTLPGGVPSSLAGLPTGQGRVHSG